ncbi:helicase-like protein, putative [Medicago truncatula]|uniref:Helicase-like protein, putative n=1 Tax=Medicago truncatula TaxID=3880 RepID=G7IBA0_MEDTR|nr:helicase-like protein, putative [Medicago truncatula]
MTSNKSQGQSLDYVGLYLPRSVFSHDLKIVIHENKNQALKCTTNVVFKEDFENLKFVEEK